MFENLEIAKEKVSFYKDKIRRIKVLFLDKEINDIYLEIIDSILKELKLFENNINSVQANFIKDISSKWYDLNSLKNEDKVITNYWPDINLKSIEEYNFILIERLNLIKLNNFDEYFEDDVQYYKYINEVFSEINKIRLDFKNFTELRKINSKTIILLGIKNMSLKVTSIDL